MLDILGKESKFEKYAQIAANDYLNNGTSLNDSIVKIAEDKELNPDQIKRVVEAANVKVFQKHFEEEDREGHKDVDFDVADPKVIIRRIYVVKKPESSSPLEHMPSPLDFFKDLSSDNFCDREESCVEDLPEEKSKMDRPTLVIRIKTAKKNLEKKAYEINEEYVDRATEFSKKFRRTVADSPEEFNSLCKLAYEHNGDLITDVLNSIANYAKIEAPSIEDVTIEKVAGLTTPDLEKVSELKELADLYRRYEKAAEMADLKLKTLE